MPARCGLPAGSSRFLLVTMAAGASLMKQRRVADVDLEALVPNRALALTETPSRVVVGDQELAVPGRSPPTIHGTRLRAASLFPHAQSRRPDMRRAEFVVFEVEAPEREVGPARPPATRLKPSKSPVRRRDAPAHCGLQPPREAEGQDIRQVDLGLQVSELGPGKIGPGERRDRTRDTTSPVTLLLHSPSGIRRRTSHPARG